MKRVLLRTVRIAAGTVLWLTSEAVANAGADRVSCGWPRSIDFTVIYDERAVYQGSEKYYFFQRDGLVEWTPVTLPAQHLKFDPKNLLLTVITNGNSVSLKCTPRPIVN